jgi:hypothetical protein
MTAAVTTTMAVAKVTAMTTMTATAGKASIAAGIAAGMGVTAAMSATGTARAAAAMTTTGTAMATTTLMNSVAAHAQGSGGEQCHKQQIAHDAIILESGSKSSSTISCATLRAVRNRSARLLPSSSAQRAGKLTDAGRLEKPA